MEQAADKVRLKINWEKTKIMKLLENVEDTDDDDDDDEDIFFKKVNEF